MALRRSNNSMSRVQCSSTAVSFFTQEALPLFRFLTGHRTCALGEEGHLLDQQRIANYRLPALSSVNVMGTRVTYAVQGPAACSTAALLPRLGR